jgi:hypothetical protein
MGTKTRATKGSVSLQILSNHRRFKYRYQSKVYFLTIPIGIHTIREIEQVRRIIENDCIIGAHDNTQEKYKNLLNSDSLVTALSSGEFVGLVADNPEEKIKLKMFHAEIINDADKLNEEVSRYKDIPVVSNVTQQQVLDNYYQVKMEVKRLIGEEVERLKKELKE